MIIINCDKCKKDITEISQKGVHNGQNYYQNSMRVLDSEEFYLCEDCKLELKDLVNNWLK